MAAGLTLVEGPPQATADTVRLPKHGRSITTDDGLKVTLAARGESITRVQPLTVSGMSREAFVRIRTRALIPNLDEVRTKRPKAAKGLRGELTVGWQIGCMVGIESFAPQIGGTAGIGGKIGLLWVGNPPAALPGAEIGPSAGVTANMTVTMTPGKIVAVPFGRKKIEGDETGIRVREGHLHIHGCAGPVTIRSAATLLVATSRNDDGTSIYGRPLQL